MPKEEKSDLLKFLAPFSEDIQERAMWLRDFVWDLYPQANELIYDNYNAVAFGWSPIIGCKVWVERSEFQNNGGANLYFGFKQQRKHFAKL